MIRCSQSYDASWKYDGFYLQTLYTCTKQDICNYASVFYGVKGIKESSSDHFKDLAYWDLETIILLYDQLYNS